MSTIRIHRNRRYSEHKTKPFTGVILTFMKSEEFWIPLRFDGLRVHYTKFSWKGPDYGQNYCRGIRVHPLYSQ